TKIGSKFNTIVHEYDKEPSTLSKSRAKLRRESVYKTPRLERQPNATAGTSKAAEDAPIANEGASAISTPVHAP
nr:hypothetical protein [Tanacetum cinerariifolium]